MFNLQDNNGSGTVPFSTRERHQAKAWPICEWKTLDCRKITQMLIDERKQGQTKFELEELASEASNELAKDNAEDQSSQSKEWLLHIISFSCQHNGDDNGIKINKKEQTH